MSNTQSRKAKGRRLQQWLANELLSNFKDLTCNDVRSIGMGQQGADVLLSEKAQQKIGAAFECKNTEKVNIWSAYDQALANAKSHEAIVIIKRNYREPLALLDAKALIRLLSGGST